MASIITDATIIDQPAVTLFTSSNGLLCKQFSLDPDGTVRKIAAANMSTGSMQHVYVPTPERLNDLLNNLAPTQAISIGTLRGGVLQTNVTTAARPMMGAMSRTKDNFFFPPDEPGWFLWDYDADQMPQAVRARVQSLGGPWGALCHIWPEAAHAGYVLRPSSSDGIMGATSEGWHGFIQMRSAGAIPAALDVLFHRAWLAGLGWIKIGASGSCLPRTIVDASVGSPERLIFEAPPILGPGIWRTESRSNLQKGLFLSPPTMTDQDRARAILNIEGAKREIQPEADRIRARSVRDRVDALVERTGMSHPAAHKTVAKMMQGATLDDDFQLQVGDGSYVTVSEILDAPDAWHLRGIPDPLEGMAYGSDKATFLLKPRPGRLNERPVLVSHAHGIRTIYRFARYENPAPRCVLPFYAAPSEPRIEAIAAHGEAIRSWASRACNEVRGARQVKELFATTEDPEARALGRGAIMGTLDLNYYPAPYLTKATPVTRAMLTGAQGVGKTDVLLDVLVENDDVSALVLMPDHNMAREAAERFAAKGGTGAVVLHGRDAVDPSYAGKQMCLIPGTARRVVAHGLSVSLTLCNGCPHSKRCGYQKQVASLDQARVIFAPHDWAWLPLPGGAKPDLLIFDERPRDFGVTDDRLPLEALKAPLTYDGPWADQEEAEAVNGAYIAPLMTALDWAGRDYPWCILQALRVAGWGRESIMAAHDGLDFFEPNKVLNQCLHWIQRDLGRVDEALAAPIKPIRQLRALFRALADEIDFGQIQALKVQVKDDKFHVTSLKHLANCERSPFLHLDGTGDHALMQLLFGEMEHHHHPVERNAIITQVTGHTFSKSGVTGAGRDGEWLERSRDTARDLADIIPPDAAVFSYKSAADELGLTGSDRFGWFNAIRGSNQWEDRDTGFVIGRNQPAPGEVEHLAAPFAVAAGVQMLASVYGKEWRGIRMTDGSATPLEVVVHPDIWAQRVLEQMREKEIEQAMDRTRLIHNATPKRIYLLCPVVVDATIYETKDWFEFKSGGSRIERAFAAGSFVPLSGHEAVRIYPEIWLSKDSAYRDLDATAVLEASKTSNLSQSVNKDSIYEMRQVSPIYEMGQVWLVRYRTSRPYAYSVEAYVIGSYIYLRSIVEARAGNLREFEVISQER